MHAALHGTLTSTCFVHASLVSPIGRMSPTTSPTKATEEEEEDFTEEEKEFYKLRFT